MLISEVQDIIPQPQSTNVALNTPIVIVLKEHIECNIETMVEVTYLTTTQVLQQYPPVDKTETVRCEGIAITKSS